MKKLNLLLFSFVFIAGANFAQQKTKQGHTNQNKFRQLKDELATPNRQHTASGAPGVAYTQQKVDYNMDIVLDDDNQRIYGNETITYHNNSVDKLAYLWVQLDQNMRAADSKTPDIQPNKIPQKLSKSRFDRSFPSEAFDGGFKIEGVTNLDGSDLSYTINQTMMRINLTTPLASGDIFEFKIKFVINGVSNFENAGSGLGTVLAQIQPSIV